MKRRVLPNRRGEVAYVKPKWLITTLMLLLIGVVILSVSFYRMYSNRKWLGDVRFTVLAFDGENNRQTFYVKSFDPISREGIRLNLPADLEIVTLNGRGTWRLEVMPKLAARFGWQWAADSIMDTLGLAYVGLEDKLSPADKFSWSWYGKGVAFKPVDLSETALLEKNDTVDGAKVLGLSTVWEDKAQQWFVSAALVEMEDNVRIVNTLNVSGLGSHAARVLEHAGLRVGAIEANSDRIVDKCEVRANQVNLTTKFVQQTFGCEFIQIQQPDSQVVLLLGRDYLKQWLGKEQ